jgi:hypothetical protein
MEDNVKLIEQRLKLVEKIKEIVGYLEYSSNPIGQHLTLEETSKDCLEQIRLIRFYLHQYETLLLIEQAIPISDILVDTFNKSQTDWTKHPLTCDKVHEDCEVNKDDDKEGILIATPKCWQCPCGNYRQRY